MQHALNLTSYELVNIICEQSQIQETLSASMFYVYSYLYFVLCHFLFTNLYHKATLYINFCNEDVSTFVLQKTIML